MSSHGESYERTVKTTLDENGLRLKKVPEVGDFSAGSKHFDEGSIGGAVLDKRLPR